MKQIKIYFGKQQDGILGSFADVITLESVSEDDAKWMVNALLDNERKWYGIRTPKGTKYINLTNVLWFDVNDVEEGGAK